MNETVLSFLKHHNIDRSFINNQRLMSVGDYNHIFKEYGFYDQGEERIISIADIIGYDYEEESNLFEAMGYLFDIHGSGYQTRSCKDLFKTPEEMLSSNSFKSEPIYLLNLNPEVGIYVIGHNGIHRFSALRSLYLSELSKNPDKKEEIKKKYSIPAIVQDINTSKTYSNLILSQLEPTSYIRNERDENLIQTGKVIIESNGDKKVFSDEELISYVRSLGISRIYDNPYLSYMMVRNPDFEDFVHGVLDGEELKNEF